MLLSESAQYFWYAAVLCKLLYQFFWYVSLQHSAGSIRSKGVVCELPSYLCLFAHFFQHCIEVVTSNWYLSIPRFEPITWSL